METDNLLRMAREAGIPETQLMYWPKSIEAFARLIAADCAEAAYERYARERGQMIHGTGIYFEMARDAIKARYKVE